MLKLIKHFVFIACPLLLFPSCATRPVYRESGLASWYSQGFQGKTTACGEIYNSRALTAAHPSLPCGTRLKVVEPRSGRTVTVRVNDRGPFVRGRIVDLSLAAARRLGIEKNGTASVVLTLAAR